MSQKISLILADDHVLFRKSLVSLLSSLSNMEVQGQANNGRELLDLLKDNEPDIVLLDYSMPVMNGLEAMEIICNRYPALKVIMLSFYIDHAMINQLMVRGVRAVLHKDCEVEELINAITQVYEEGYYFGDRVSRALLAGTLRQNNLGPTLQKLQLSERELQVLSRLCQGQTNKEIASSLSITPRTVDFHRGNLYGKTGCENLAQLIIYSVKNRLVEMNDAGR